MALEERNFRILDILIDLTQKNGRRRNSSSWQK